MMLVCKVNVVLWSAACLSSGAVRNNLILSSVCRATLVSQPLCYLNDRYLYIVCLFSVVHMVYSKAEIPLNPVTSVRDLVSIQLSG